MKGPDVNNTAMIRRNFQGMPREGLQFLRTLKRNNRREWFQKNKQKYDDTVKRPMQELISILAEDFEEWAPEMVANPKTSLYRIYRDTRFSRDKSPYKTHVAGVFPRKGLGKHEGAGFYFHVSTDEVLIAGGMYMPCAETLNTVRSHIAENVEEFRSIVASRAFRKLFGELGGEQLTRVPRGYRADHPAAEYLKYKQFLVGRDFEPGLALGPKFYGQIVVMFRGMLPLIRFLNAPLVRAIREKEFQTHFIRAAS